MPTQVPIGSMRGSFDFTAILARKPGSRAAAFNSRSPSSSSGTSSSNRTLMSSGVMRDKTNCGPRRVRSTFSRYARTRSPTRRFSFGIVWSRGKSASMRPDSMITLPRSIRLIVPVTSNSSRSRKSLNTCSRSASRIFCRMTCFAVCAPMRPKSTGSSGSSIMSPSSRPSPRSGASVMAIWRAGSSCSSSGTTTH